MHDTSNNTEYEDLLHTNIIGDVARKKNDICPRNRSKICPWTSTGSRERDIRKHVIPCTREKIEKTLDIVESFDYDDIH